MPLPIETKGEYNNTTVRGKYARETRNATLADTPFSPTGSPFPGNTGLLAGSDLRDRVAPARSVPVWGVHTVDASAPAEFPGVSALVRRPLPTG